MHSPFFFLQHPIILIRVLITKLSPIIPSTLYIKTQFRLFMGYPLNLKDPTTYNEKLQWIKLYDHNPLYTKLVDKYEVKKYVEEKIGCKYVIPTLNVWDDVNSIDWDSLPSQFVLKTTKGGDNKGVFVCKDKSSVNITELKKQLAKALKQDLYKTSKEWPYKNVKQRIIAEQYMEDSETKELRDYKFFCFNGKVKAMFVATNRQRNKKPNFDFFDAHGEWMPIKQGYENNPTRPALPENYEEMIQVAETLSVGLRHVRVDLYSVNGDIYFGEFTFFHFGGFQCFIPQKWDCYFGEFISI